MSQLTIVFAITDRLLTLGYYSLKHNISAANTKSPIQPCDQGIIRAFKAFYRREIRTQILENVKDSPNPTASNLVTFFKLFILCLCHG